MSRCFPFPPPGYEKAAQLSDTDLLTKEKHKEKKHKNNKAKREGKERKKDREGSRRKHKEKKDRKEKNKDKKDRDKDKEKKRTLDGENIIGSLDGENNEKLGSNCLHNGETTDSKFLLELGKITRDEGGARENRMFQIIAGAVQRGAELPGRVVESNIGSSTEGKEIYKSKREDDRNVSGQRNKIEGRGVKNGFIQNCVEVDQKRIERVGRPVDKDVNKQWGKENHKHKNGDNRGDTHQDRVSEMKRKSKDKDGTREKGMVEKAKEKEQYKEQPIFGESSKNAIGGRNIRPSNPLKDGYGSSNYNGILVKRKALETNGILPDGDAWPNKLPRLISSSHKPVENGRKLESCQITLPVESESQAIASSHKVECKATSCSQIHQNGRKLGPGSVAVHSALERRMSENGSNIDKEASIRGSVEVQQLNACSNKPLSTPPVRPKKKVEAPPKRMHPDSKYMSQIISVPKVAEWSDFDDQQWLFSSDNLHKVKDKACFLKIDQAQEVCARASRIESVDVIALPYVIPF